jgi:hypothetical protein
MLRNQALRCTTSALNGISDILSDEFESTSTQRLDAASLVDIFDSHFGADFQHVSSAGH